MLASLFGRAALVGAIVAGLVAPAPAQVLLDAPGLSQRRAAPPPPVRALPTVWPRLDPGAVLCRTADDLDRHASNMTARVSGGYTSAADCRIIAQPTGIQIVKREGLGRTLVQTGNETGWTDAWLPDKAPANR